MSKTLAFQWARVALLAAVIAGPGLLVSSCLGSGAAGRRGAPSRAAVAAMRTTQFELVDSSRQRVVPVVAYFPAGLGAAGRPKLKLALLNHGYGGQNTAYTFVARNLVAHGYYVASLQQDLPGDVPMPPTTSNVYQARYPYWERGVRTMLFARRALGRRYPQLDTSQVLLMGHSNGGDMVMLFAQQHPKLVQKVITFDNRRVPFPRQRQPVLLSLRSSDQVADAGVVPTPAEQAKYGMTVVQLPATLHNDMWDGATDQQKQEMNAWISRFLE